MWLELAGLQYIALSACLDLVRIYGLIRQVPWYFQMSSHVFQIFQLKRFCIPFFLVLIFMEEN